MIETASQKKLSYQAVHRSCKLRLYGSENFKINSMYLPSKSEVRKKVQKNLSKIVKKIFWFYLNWLNILMEIFMQKYFIYFTLKLYVLLHIR